MLIWKRKKSTLLSKLKNPLQILFFIFFRTIQAQYFFKNAEDQQICEIVDLVEISPYRGMSMTQMSWQSAHACCKMKGRILHTIERNIESEEYALKKVLPDKLGNEAEELQFWIGLSFHKDDFRWSFGTSLKKFFGTDIHETYRWADGNPDMTSSGGCVAISPFKQILEMRTAHCNTKFNFICQKILRTGGEPLSGQDMMEVGSTEFITIPDFDNLRFSKTFARWPVANAICQSRNWALIDRIHERYGDKLAGIIQHSIYMFNKSSRVIHTGGNDFCAFHSWQWTCGENLEGTIPWSLNAKSHAQDKPESNKHCLQYTVEPVKNAVTSTFVTNTVGCNEFAYTICDTTPSCPVGDQYHCLYKDPYFIDLEVEAKDERNYCETIKFQSWNDTRNHKNTTLWMSPAKFTWLGANNCCKSRGWAPVAPKSQDELEYLQRVVLEAVISLCDDETKCDGFWTSTSTIGYLPHSPLRFTDGKLLSRNLYSSIRADGFSYPTCGRINYMDLKKFQTTYVLADCLEKNFIVCEETGTKNHNIMSRKAIDIFEGVDEFQQSVYDKFFLQPTEDEKGRRITDYKRDSCHADDMEKQYSVGCPDSTTKIELDGKANKDPHHVEAKIIVPFQNKHILMEELLAHAFHSSNDTTKSDPYAYQFLNVSANLFTEFCPLVPRSFLTLALKLFFKLHHILNPKPKIEIITKVHFDWAMKLLGKCETLLKPVVIKYDSCGDLIMAEKSCDNFVCTDSKYEFNIQRTDILVDVVWKVFEAVHAACFPAFKQNVMLHHKYALVIADLWDKDGIRIRWSHPLASKKFWKRLLGPFFEHYVLNIERCTKATITDSYFHVRLPRTTVPHTVRMTGFSYGKL